MVWLMSLGVIAVLTMPPGAQGTAADDRELLQYRLTAEVLAKAEGVARTFDANVAKDPKTRRRLDAQREIALLDKKDHLTEADEKRLEELQAIVGDEPIDLGINGGSLSEISAQLQKIPAMAAALKSVGMQPRDFAKFIVTAVQAAMIGGLPGQGAPPGVPGDNVRFVRANLEAMERINRLLGAP